MKMHLTQTQLDDSFLKESPSYTPQNFKYVYSTEKNGIDFMILWESGVVRADYDFHLKTVSVFRIYNHPITMKELIRKYKWKHPTQRSTTILKMLLSDIINKSVKVVNI